MAQITHNKTLTINGETWWVNSTGSGLYLNMIKAIINQLEAMLFYYRKVHVLRFDLRQYDYSSDNGRITIFNRRLFKWLKSNYDLKHVGFAWCREQETAKQQHYHFVLMLDGDKVYTPHKITERILLTWKRMDGSAFIPKNCFYMVNRNNRESIQKAIWRISYLAKVRGKGYKPAQTKNYGTSRIS